MLLVNVDPFNTLGRRPPVSKIPMKNSFTVLARSLVLFEIFWEFKNLGCFLFTSLLTFLSNPWEIWLNNNMRRNCVSRDIISSLYSNLLYSHSWEYFLYLTEKQLAVTFCIWQHIVWYWLRSGTGSTVREPGTVNFIWHWNKCRNTNTTDCDLVTTVRPWRVTSKYIHFP